jgi:hypothetical protein
MMFMITPLSTYIYKYIIGGKREEYNTSSYKYIDFIAFHGYVAKLPDEPTYKLWGFSYMYFTTSHIT